MRKLLPIFVLTAFFLGCDSKDEIGIRDSRESFMVELKAALERDKIPFSVDEEGYVRYSRKHKEAVEKITKEVDASILSEVGSKFEDEVSTSYFRKLLDEAGIKYRTESKGDEDWTYWRPKSVAQQKEIEMKVVSHSFQLRRKSKE